MAGRCGALGCLSISTFSPAKIRVRYIPDFLVRMESEGKEELTVIWEVKGYEDPQAKMKRAAADKWVRAVNNDGTFGRWGCRVCKNPNTLGADLAAYELEQ